jgi:hypothetical protein
MRRVFSSSFSLSALALGLMLLMLVNGCRKQEYELLIEGVWTRVDVSDIDLGTGEEWEMFNNNINIYRYNIQNPSVRWLNQQAKYVIERKGSKLYLKLANLNNGTFNTRWDIFELSEEKLIISIEVPGGVFYQEFVKKIGN